MPDRLDARGRTLRQVPYGGSGGGTGAPFGSAVLTDTVGTLDVSVNQSETNTVQTESQSFVIFAALGDETNSTPSESNGIDFASVPEQNSPPVIGHSTSVTLGATTATATNTAGNGWAAPTNAQGINDNTQATANSASGISPANQAGTLDLSFASLGTVATETSSSLSLTVYATLTVGTLATGTLTISYSIDGGSSYTQLTSQAATAAGPFTTPLAGITASNIGQLRIRAVTSVTGSAVAAATATFDAAVVTFTTTGNNAG